MIKLIPQEVIKELGDRAKMAQMHAKLLEIHNTLIEKIDVLNKKGDKGDDGDTPTQEELLGLIVPLVDELGVQLKGMIPTIEDIKNLIPPPHPTPTLPSITEMVEALKPHIPKVKNGKDAKIDHELLAKQIQPYIKIPKAKVPEITHDMIMGAIKDKLKPEHIKGLEVYMDGRIRPYMSGGGDSIDAGSNITITVVNGKKVISTSGGASLSVLSVTGTVNDTNTSFTIASSPTLVAVNGVLYRTTGDSITWTYLAGTLTLSQPVGSNGSIYALG